MQRRLEYETVWKPHATVAVLVERDGRYLCVEERIRGRVLLNQPAGHLEPGESLIDAAIREALEESGHHVQLTGLVGVYQWRSPSSGKHFLRMAFAGISVGHDRERQLDEGILRTVWLTPDEVRHRQSDLRSPMVLRGIEEHAAGRLFPLDILTNFDPP